MKKNEWEDELDQLFFRHRNIDCKILRHNGFGHLCGYVRIPYDHPWYDMVYDNIPIDCHGGLTYGAMEDGSFWVGFDCGHQNDLKPYIKNFGSCVYRNMDYVKKEVEKMADQVADSYQISSKASQEF